MSALKELKSLKENEKNFDDTKSKTKFSMSRIEKIKKEFNNSRYKFFKSKTSEIRRNLYEIENISASKIKEIEKNLLKLEKNLYKSKKYYDNDYDYDNEYIGKRDVKDLFDLSIDKDCYKPIITNGVLIITIFNMKVKEIRTKY